MTTPARKLLLICVTLTLVLAACAPVTTPAPTAQPTQPPAPTTAPTQPPQPTAAPTPEPTAAPTGLTCEGGIKVGLVGDYTGPLAIYGVMQLRSFMLGLEYAAGAPGSVGEVYALENGPNTFTIENCEITVIPRDDKGDPAVTATVARELIDVEKVDVLIGSVSSPTTATLQGLAKDNQKVLIVAPAAANDITGANFNEYTFRVSRNNYQDFINLCEYLTTQHKTFVQIAPDTNFGRGGAQSARDACTKFGGEFVADDIYAPIETTEFTPYMEQILASGAEAWIVTWAGGGFVPMFKAAQEVGVTDEMALGASIANNATVPVFYSTLIGQNSGILYHYTLPDNEINDWLVAELKSRYNAVADLFDADGMNAALALVAGLLKSGGDASAEALIAALEGVEFDGPKGTILIRPEDHVAIQDMYIVKILNVDDPEAKFFELVETTRPEPPCLLPEAEKARCGSLPYGSLAGTP
jgi:branched-chain amino acid transport system substrate-binding protein